MATSIYRLVGDNPIADPANWVDVNGCKEMNTALVQKLTLEVRQARANLAKVRDDRKAAADLTMKLESEESGLAAIVDDLKSQLWAAVIGE